MRPLQHCVSCGEHAAILTVQGERSCLYTCQVCHEGHEIDRPRIRPIVTFESQAKWLAEIPASNQ